MPPRSPSWTEAINPCQSTSASLFQQDDNACLTLIQRAWGGWRAPPPAEERIILHTDLRAGASPTLTTPGFHRTAGICTRSRFLVKKATASTFWRSEGTRDITIKREGERDGNYTAVHSGKLPSCQACLDARTRPRFTADLPPKLLMPNISCFPICLCWSLSLSLLSHMLALPDSQPPLQIWFHSLSLSLSGVVMVTTFWYYRPSVLEEELEFDTEIPSQCPLPKPGARMHAGRMFLQKNPQTCWIFTFSLCSIFPLLTI